MRINNRKINWPNLPKLQISNISNLIVPESIFAIIIASLVAIVISKITLNIDGSTKFVKELRSKNYPNLICHNSNSMDEVDHGDYIFHKEQCRWVVIDNFSEQKFDVRKCTIRQND